MTPESARALSRYNRWMNEKLFAVAAQLSDDERKQDRGAFFKSIHATLNHLLVADRIWLARFTGVQLERGFMGPGIRSLDQELYWDFDELRRARAETDAALETWTETLTSEQLVATLRYGKNERPLWWTVTHLFNHQTHHRGQITTLLTQAGHDVGVTDFNAMPRGEP